MGGVVPNRFYLAIGLHRARPNYTKNRENSVECVAYRKRLPRSPNSNGEVNQFNKIRFYCGTVASSRILNISWGLKRRYVSNFPREVMVSKSAYNTDRNILHETKAREPENCQTISGLERSLHIYFWYIYMFSEIW